jgi:hypothetical protein
MDRRSRRAAWRVSSPRECVCPSTYQMLVYVCICDGCWWWWRPSGAAGWLSLVHDAFSCVCVSLHRIKKHAHKTNRTNKRGSLSHFSSATEPSLGTSFSSCPSAQHIRDPLTQFCVFLFCFHRSRPIYPPLAALSLLPDWRRYSFVSFNETLIVMLVSSVFFLALVNRIYLTFFYFSLKQ